MAALVIVWNSPARAFPGAVREVTPADPKVQAALREASEIALKQANHQYFWTSRVLRQIGELQIQARDFDGALRSIQGCSRDESDREAGTLHLAKALAGAGKWERALDMLRLLGTDHGWDQDGVDDDVRLQWIEYLIETADLDRAAEAFEQLKSSQNRSIGLRKLAVACATSGDASRAAERFALAVAATAAMKEPFDRARGLWEIGEAQLTVGSVDAAKTTIRRLVDAIDPKDASAHIHALREAAVLTAKANDAEAARQLFQRAVAAAGIVDSRNRIDELIFIATAQAGVGYINDARQTAAMLMGDEHQGNRDQALLAIALAQLKTNDGDGAVQTAFCIKRYIQYRDDALHKIVESQIAKHDLNGAVATAEKIDNPSSKATAILRVATAYAQAGDRKIAGDVAARVELTAKDRFPGLIGKQRFDYRRPLTWGVCYGAGAAFTMSSIHLANQDAAEVAAAAMTLAQELGQQPATSYAVSFKDINTEVVIQALARSHAASGDVTAALNWARQIGQNRRVPSEDDFTTLWAVEQRIHALIGVAEGILCRSGEEQPGRHP